MSKQILVISGSPRKGGNSDMLCDEFIKGVKEMGHNAEKIYISEKKIGFCRACYACKKDGICVQKDDVGEILEKMVSSDIVVLATPVYYYTMNGQMKTLIDRALPRYYTNKISDKDFYFIVTAAENKSTMERTIDGLRGFTDCLDGAKIKGIVYGEGVYEKGDVKGTQSMEEAYKMGLNVGDGK